MDPVDNESNDLINEQIRQNNVDLEQKRSALTAERLDIIKSSGAHNWSPAPPPALGTAGTRDASNSVGSKIMNQVGIADQARNAAKGRGV